MILLLLGFWDLFAVMTPIGPLRWLVDLVHEKGTPLPGLLFQADIVDAHVDPSAKARSSGSCGIASGKAAQGGTGSQDHQKQGISASTSTTQTEATEAAVQSCKHRDDQQEDEYDEYDDKTIKLGLGDFIFYSVLVARAAMHGMAVFAACFLCILVVRTRATFRLQRAHLRLTQYSLCVLTCAGPGGHDVPPGQVRRAAGTTDLHLPQHPRVPAHDGARGAISRTSRAPSRHDLLI